MSADRGPLPDRLRIVVPRYGASVVGGAEGAMRSLSHALAVRGWSVEVWTTTAVDEASWSEGFPPGSGQDGDVRVRRFPVVGGRRPWLFRQLSRAAYHLPRPLAPEHLWAMAQGPYAPSLVRALARAEPVPALFSPYLFHPILYGLPAAPHPRILCPAAHDEPALRLGVVRREVLAADALWFHSPEERDLLFRKHPRAAGIPSQCGVVGVDPPPAVDPGAFAARRGIGGQYLYYGGRSAAGKGFQELLAAAASLHRTRPSLSLVISGEAGAAARAPGVHVVGRLDERERWEAIAGAVAVVVPGALESLSLLALESWAMGRPCLVNSASAVLAGHARRSGGAIAFSGPHQLAAAALELVDDAARATVMGAAGRQYVLSTYRWDAVVERLRLLIAAALR